ncbi:MAG: DUF350 domain-containing protein [Chloroflexi bacterium]|nr:DUF350 domain-containing protein [Chloroflexota bacterium]
MEELIKWLATEFRIFLVSMFYAIVGIILLFAAYKIFDFLTPTNMNKAIFEDKNVAVAVSVGAFLLGIALIIAGAIKG